MIKKNISYIVCLAVFLGGVAFATDSHSREQVRIVGSSTLFPFVASAAESYSEKAMRKAPIAESIGTGAGFLEFCKGVGEKYPDIVSASRPIIATEQSICDKNNVGKLLEIPLGVDGIVIATAIEAKTFGLTKQQLFAGLAKEIVVDGKITANTHKKWSDVDATLPDIKIEVYGPSSTSGTRDAFVELVFEPVCIVLPEVQQQFPNPAQGKDFCHAIREDGAYIEAGENDNLIVQKLSLNKTALGIFGYNYLEQNMDKVQPIEIDGIAPDFENVADGKYPIARMLYIYVKTAHLQQVTDLKGFVQEITSDEAISNDGYLVDRGLIPLSEKQRQKMQKMVAEALK